MIIDPRMLLDLIIYSISFNVIQPMLVCRQIPKHKIAGKSKRRNQPNKQNQNETPHVTQRKSSSRSGGLYPFWG
jgi:hypothetical protein